MLITYGIEQSHAETYYLARVCCGYDNYSGTNEFELLSHPFLHLTVISNNNCTYYLKPGILS